MTGISGWLVVVSTAAPLGDLRLYECVPTAQAPTIDGRLDDPVWQSAAVTSGFVRVLTEADKPPSVQTHVRLLYDDQYLYVAVVCEEPNPQAIKATVIEEDTAAVCGDDAIELFFQPDPESPAYFQLVSNSRGVRYDGCILDPSWNARWVAACTVGPEAWFLECRIALDSFPDRRAIWRFNVCREFRSRPVVEYHCWSNTYGPFHSPSHFGHLIFGGRLAGLRRAYLIEAGALARATLYKEEALDRMAAELHRLRPHVPADRLGRLTDTLARLARGRADLESRYAGRKELSIAEWTALDQALGRLKAELDTIYWDIKFLLLIREGATTGRP